MALGKKENFIRAIQRNNPEWVPYWLEGSYQYVYPTFVEMNFQGGYDDWGCYWDYNKDSGAYPSEKYVIKSIDEVDSFEAPDPNAPGLLDAAREAISKIDRDKTVVQCVNHIGIHERAYILMGMEDYLCELILNEEKVDALYEKIFQFKLKFSIRMMEELDIDGIWLGDDWGTQNSLMMSPELWRRLIKPRMKKLYDTIHEMGGFVVQHSCGKIEEIIPDLIEIGLDVWNPCQPCNDLGMLKKNYGKNLTFMGGVDSSIIDLKGDAEIQKEIQFRAEQLKDGGGYVLYPSHHVDFPEENVKSFIKYAKEYGKY